jgi:hypothetical protein
MVDAEVFNIDDFLWTDSCVSSTQLKRGFNRASLHLQTLKLQEVFFSNP